MPTLYSMVNETRNRNRILEMCKFRFWLVHWIDPRSIEHSYACFLTICRVFATVCKTVRPMLSVHCLSCPVCLSVLSVTFVHCGQTVGRIKMKLGRQVGLVPGHIVFGGDPAPPPLKGHSLPPILGPYLLRPNGCMDQDVT